jgi:hypothetical protein
VGNTYSARDFLDKLIAGEMVSPLRLTGLAKEPSEDSDSILFAAGGACENWVSIPTEMVTQVEMLSMTTCDDHSHPLVSLTFATPSSTEGQVLEQLLHAVILGAQAALRDVQRLSPGSDPEMEPLKPSGELSPAERCAKCWRVCNSIFHGDYFRCLEWCAPHCP